MTSLLEAARTRYIAEYDTFAEAAAVINSELRRACQASGIRTEVSAREKDIASFVKKIVTKPDYQHDPWNKTTDKVGARVIVETKGDVERAVEAIRTSHLVIVGEIEDKRLSNEPTALVYPGTHFQVIVPGLAQSDGSPVECEVQVRTKAEDLWSVPSHKLTYKAPVEPPRLTKRRMWRLSVLVELFDEEVETAMAEVASLPGYESARLLDIAETVYLTFVVERGDRELSLDVLNNLGSVVLPHNPDDYSESLRLFGDEHRLKLSMIYQDFGCHSPWAGELDYWLFSQPESIIIFHKIETDAAGLRTWMVGADLSSAMTPLFEAWGVPAVIDVG